MFDMPVFVFMSAIALMANLIAVPRLVDYATFHTHCSESSAAQLRKAMLLKGIFISISAVALGCYAAPRIGLGAPLIKALVYLHSPYSKISQVLMPALAGCAIIIGSFLLHKALLRNRLKPQTTFSIPLLHRVLEEGVIEELVFRWGLMSICALLLVDEFGLEVDTALGFALPVSALASSLSHIADLPKLHFEWMNVPTPIIFLLNFWAALCFGWLFWKFGLTVSIFCHVLVLVMFSYGQNLSQQFLAPLRPEI